MKYRILHIEDSHDYLTAAKQMFEDFDNVELVQASSGPKGLELFKESKFDIVICDFLMPRMDGDEVVRQIRLTSTVPIIANSSLGSYNGMMIKAGATTSHPKEFSPHLKESWMETINEVAAHES